MTLRLPAVVALLIVLALLPAFTACSLYERLKDLPCRPRSVVETLEERDAHVRSFLGMGEVVVRSVHMEYRAQLLVAYLRPDYVLIKVFHPALGPLWLVTIQQGQALFMDFTQNRYSRASVNEGWVRVAPGIIVPLRPFLAAASGNVDPIPFDVAACWENPEDRVLTLSLKTVGPKPKTQVIRLESSALRPKGFELHQDGLVQFAVVFRGTLNRDAAVPSPRRVSVEMPGHFTRVDITYRQVQVNPELSPEQFRVSVPTHVIRDEEPP